MDPCTDRDDRLITHLGGFPGQAIRDLVPRTRQIFGRLPTVARLEVRQRVGSRMELTRCRSRGSWTGRTLADALEGAEQAGGLR